MTGQIRRRTFAAAFGAGLLPFRTSVFAQTQAGEVRIGLVIGNDSYRSPPAFGPLTNAVNDAKDMAALLVKAGFDIPYSGNEPRLLLNANRERMLRGVRDFGRALAAAGGDAVGFFYFAGHGMVARGANAEANMMVPVGVPISNDEQLMLLGISTESVLAEMRGARNRLNVLVVDACRGYGFTRGAPNSFVFNTITAGTLIAYSSGPGQQANDLTPTGRKNGLYTGFLLDNLAVPGRRLIDSFNLTRLSVFTAQPNQLPQELNQIMGEDIVLFPANGAVPISIPDRRLRMSGSEMRIDLLEGLRGATPDGLFVGLDDSPPTQALTKADVSQGGVRIGGLTFDGPGSRFMTWMPVTGMRDETPIKYYVFDRDRKKAGPFSIVFEVAPSMESHGRSASVLWFTFGAKGGGRLAWTSEGYVLKQEGVPGLLPLAFQLNAGESHILLNTDPKEYEFEVPIQGGRTRFRQNNGRWESFWEMKRVDWVYVIPKHPKRIMFQCNGIDSWRETRAADELDQWWQQEKSDGKTLVLRADFGNDDVAHLRFPVNGGPIQRTVSKEGNTLKQWDDYEAVRL